LSERPDDLFFDDFIKISFAIKTLLFWEKLLEDINIWCFWVDIWRGVR
jgi:hypothetical protein